MVWALRRVVTGAIEVARNAKTIGSSLQAGPHFYLTSAHRACLEGVDFAEICICSSLALSVDKTPPSGAFALPDVPDAGVVFVRAEGQKCERCWQVTNQPGEANGYLCNRCHDAVISSRKTAA